MSERMTIEIDEFTARRARRNMERAAARLASEDIDPDKLRAIAEKVKREMDQPAPHHWQGRLR